MWSKVKHYIRERQSGSIVTLRPLVEQALAQIATDEGRSFVRRLWQKVFRFAALYARGATGQDAQKEENAESKLRRIEEYHQAIRAVRGDPGEGATVKRSHRTPSARVDDVVEQLPLEFDIETAPDSELAVLFGEAAAAEGWDDDPDDILDSTRTSLQTLRLSTVMTRRRLRRSQTTSHRTGPVCSDQIPFEQPNKRPKCGLFSGDRSRPKSGRRSPTPLARLHTDTPVSHLTTAPVLQ